VSVPNEFDVIMESAGQNALVVRVSGDLDLATSPRFSETLAGARAASHVVIDLTGCTFLDSSGVRALVQATRKIPESERRVDLVAGSPAILRVLEITGLDRMVRVHGSLEDAL
jgi:anti-sigma B factor antagonist